MESPEYGFPAWMFRDGREWIISDKRQAEGLWALGWRFERGCVCDSSEDEPNAVELADEVPVVEFKRKRGRPRK